MRAKILLCIFIASSFTFEAVNAARILVIASTPSRSHHIWNSALTLGLAKKGHKIITLSTDPEKEPHPNLKHIILEGSYDKVQENFDLESMIHDTPFDTLRTLWSWGLETCRYQANSKGAQELLSMPTDSFDLIIMEYLCNECMFMYLHHFGGGTRIPIVGLTAFGIGPWTDIATGGWTMPSVFVLPILPYLSRMNIWERLLNTLLIGLHWTSLRYYYLPEQQKIAENAYGKSLPPLAELGSNVSIIFVNNHYAINGPQAQLPAIIEVGGMQCSPPKPLPKDIQTFLDGSEEGAIFFSLGTNVRSEFLPKEKLRIIINTFTALGPKIRVLWKFDPEVPIQGLPSNVLIKKWLPQEDILGHPKILAFVSHAGLLSTQEAMYHGKPVVGVPFFADQRTNSRKMVELKVAKHVDFLSMTTQSFTDAILTVIKDPSYRHNMQKISRLIHDQPQTPLDRAIFWTEFTLRHSEGKGRVEALRYAGLELSWYQYFLIDVFVITIFSITIIITVPVYLLCALYRRLFKSSNSKDSGDKAKKKQ